MTPVLIASTAWRIVSSPIGRVVLPALLAGTIGFHQGWSLKSRLDTSAALRAQVRIEQAARQRAEAAAEQDRKLVAQAEQERTKQQERADGLEAQISAGVCFPGADADRLRQLWRH